MNRLYLIRHGENIANLTKEFSYRYVDYPLTAKGRLQAQQTAAFFESCEIHAVYSSPLRRALETAEIIAGQAGLPVQIIEDFREVNVGDLERMPDLAAAWEQHAEVLAAWYNEQPERSFPGGEDLVQLRQRMQAGLRSILAGKQDQALLVVGHGGIFNFSLPSICPDVAPTALRHTPNHNCSISLLEATLIGERIQARLVYWASYSHLTGEAARLVAGVPDQAMIEQWKQQKHFGNEASGRSLHHQKISNI